jgi:hypothetical protein
MASAQKGAQKLVDGFAYDRGEKSWTIVFPDFFPS